MAKKYSYWLHSGAYSMLQKLSMVLFGLITFMLLARLFKSPEKFGVWSVFIVITAFVEMLRHALVKNGYILFINTCPDEEKPGIEYAAFFSNCVFSGLLAVCFFFGGGLLESALKSPGLESILQFYSLTLIFLLFFSHQEFLMVARTDFKGIFFLYFFRNGVFLLIVAICFFLGKNLSLETLAIYYGVSAVSGLAVGTLVGKKREKYKMKWDKKLFYRFINYGKFILGTNFFALMFRNTDTFMTARLVSPAGVAFYNISTRIINFAEMPVLVLSETMLPRAAQIIKTGDLSGMKNIYEKTVAAMLTLTIPFIIVVSLFTGPIIHFIAGPEYMEASHILQITVFFSFFIPFTGQFGNIMDSTNRPHVNFLVMLIFSVVNVLTNWFFISRIGLLGSAYGTLCSYFLLLTTTQILLRKYVGVSQVQIFRNIFLLYGEYFRIGKSLFNKYVKARS